MERPPPPRPTLRQLEYVVAIAESLHFGRAAAACAVTQPALSAQIRQVEDLLGARLFERGRRRVLVTPTGARVVEQARACLVRVDALVADARARSEPLSGPLRLGVIPTVAPYLLPNVLPGVRRDHPRLELLLREEPTARLVEGLLEGRLDVLLLALPVEEADLEELPLFEEPFLLAGPEDHPLIRRGKGRLAESSLRGEEVLLLEDGHCLRAQALEVCRRAGAASGGRIQATSLSTLVQMVANGLGVTLLPERAREVELRPGSGLACRRFRAPEPSRTVGLAWRRGAAGEADHRLLAASLAKATGAPRRAASGATPRRR